MPNVYQSWAEEELLFQKRTGGCLKASNRRNSAHREIMYLGFKRIVCILSSLVRKRSRVRFPSWAPLSQTLSQFWPFPTKTNQAKSSLAEINCLGADSEQTKKPRDPGLNRTHLQFSHALLNKKRDVIFFPPNFSFSNPFFHNGRPIEPMFFRFSVSMKHEMAAWAWHKCGGLHPKTTGEAVKMALMVGSL